MARHAEPMDIDDESDFDNKENTYQHTNLLPRTPCTEKGYEELDVSELNMKLRYSITPAASPMSKSMSHCLDNRNNTSIDESLNNTIINEYENNLTRSLNSTLNKTEVTLTKALPLQTLQKDIVDNSRSTSVLQPLESMVTTNDITVTVSNEHEIDDLLFPSSSSSLAQTPEATTPVKEISKLEGGSPIMRGLKSVLSMFRSSQSPVPPGDEETKVNNAVVTPAGALPPESKPQAIASTPKNENNKETNLSRRNSPLKESIVFNEDLEKELQWSDDSTIVFSSEKIPIRKLFFQEKSSKPILNENVKYEDANSTVEYMDISYNDLSIRDVTLNRTGNQSKVNEFLESDGEFVDCESSFTHKTEELHKVKANNNQVTNIPEKESMNMNAVINEPCRLDTTKDIINMIDSSRTVVEGDLGKQLDFSTTDIVNQLSDLINEATVVNNVSLVKDIDTKDSKLSDVQASINIQSECIQNQVTSLVDSVIAGSNPAVAIIEQVSIKTDNLTNLLIYSDAITTDLESSIEAKITSAPVDAITLKAPEVPHTPKHDEKIYTPPERTYESVVGSPLPVDIPLPNEDYVNETNDSSFEEAVYAELQDKPMPVASTSQNVLMAALDKSITEAPNIKSTQDESQNEVNICPPSLLSSDVPLLNTDDTINTNDLQHESITVSGDPVQSPSIVNSDLNSTDVCISKVDLVNATVNNSKTKAIADIPQVEIEHGSLKADIPSSFSLSAGDMPLPTLDDLVKANNLPQDTVDVCPDLVLENAIGKPDIIPIENNTSKVDLINEPSIIKTVGIVCDKVKTSEVVAVNTMPKDLILPEKEEHMEISFVDSTNDQFSESLTMDVSMADAIKIQQTINQPEVCQNETLVSKFKYELPENITPKLEATSADIVTADNLNQAQIQVSDDVKNESDNTIDEKSNDDIVLGPISTTAMDKHLTIDLNDTSKSLNSENFNVSADFKLCGDTEPSLNYKCDSVSSPVFQTCQLTSLTDTSDVETAANSKDEEKNVLKLLNEVPENIQDTISDFILTSAMNFDTVTQLINEQDKIPLPEITKEKCTCNETDFATVQELPICSDVSVNLDTADNLENTLRREEKVDEEIVLSESNSPFVSMSAEEVLEPALKKGEFEEVENLFSTKSKVTRPPTSPKIVSKGYNFNFDDIDSINPFATKTKIRMSPPPGPSADASLAIEDNKTEIVEPLKSDKNMNRRKSMPERKKPLKAKRHFNSSFDSTESMSFKTNLSKIGDLNISPKTESKQEQSHFSKPEVNQSDSNIVTSPIQDVAHDELDVTLSSKLSTQEEKGKREQLEAIATPIADDPKENTSVKLIDRTNTVLNNETEVVEDVISDSCKYPVKPDNTSSSEQSTYFSAGASSTELTESKNVFNLPEIDDFNPFTTKSKIPQTPPKELDTENPFSTRSKIKSSPETSFVVPQEDSNCIVTIDNAHESKETIFNGSTCSASSKTSDDKDITVHEIHTEDEDTLEGPFLEIDEAGDGNKMPEFAENKVDMVDLDNLNSQESEEAAEMFIDAEAFEFLMNQNKSDEVAYSGKESLFLKFDPLFAQRVTLEGVSAALNEIKRKQSTPKKTPKQAPTKEIEQLSFEIPGPSDLSNSHEAQSVVQEKSDDANLTISKPTMAVTPAVNPVVTPRKSLTPNKSNRLSMTFTSPAMAVIDRLLSLSSNSPSAGHDATVTYVDRTRGEADQALTQLRELLAEKEIHVYNLRCESKELKDRLSTLETHMKALEAESAERLKKVNELNENLTEKTKMNRKMAAVVEEYERTIASLISETEQDKKRFAEERNQLIRDTDEQTAHLASMEVSFNDLHSKYEKSKQVILGYKTNEEAYKKSIHEFEENLSKMHTNYELLKQHATSKLNHANQELEKINKAHEAEVLKFNAMIKRKELHITSLEESLAQKTKANEELTAICDELINKVG